MEHAMKNWAEKDVYEKSHKSKKKGRNANDLIKIALIESGQDED